MPVTPELHISNDGMATWSPVNSRSPDPVLYILTAMTDEGMVEGINIMPTIFNNMNITQDLSELNLQDGEMYRICVRANNTIGYSMMSCIESYTYTGAYIYLHVCTHIMHVYIYVYTCMYMTCKCNDSRKQG